MEGKLSYYARHRDYLNNKQKEYYKNVVKKEVDCPHCNKKFSTDYTLKKHSDKYHPNS